MKNIEKIKGIISLILTVLLGTIFIINACSNDDDEDHEPEINPLVGKYVFVSSVLTAPVDLTDEISIPAGTDVTQYVGAGLLGATPCTNQANTRIELRESGDLYYVCDGEVNELKVGTWANTDDFSQLILNLSSPPLPANLPLRIMDLIIDSSGITGNIENLPIPASIFSGLFPEGVDPSTLPPVIVSISIEFDKVD